MIEYVVGIDPSLVNTGVAAIWRHGGIRLASYGRAGHHDETLAERHRRIGQTVNWLRDWLPAGGALVVIEGPSFGSTGGSAHDRAGLWWRIAATAINRELPVAVAAPQTRAKYTTGSGGAGKHDVCQAVTRHLLVAPGNYDEADAAALAWMGAHHLGWITGTAQQTQSLAAVQWPELSDVDPERTVNA